MIYITSGDGQFPAKALDLMIRAWIMNPVTTLGVRLTRFRTYGPTRSTIFFAFKIIKIEIAKSRLRSKSTMRDAEQLELAFQIYRELQLESIPFSLGTTGNSSGVSFASLVSDLLDIFHLLPHARQLTKAID